MEGFTLVLTLVNVGLGPGSTTWIYVVPLGSSSVSPEYSAVMT
jgi:hypothetical protein